MSDHEQVEKLKKLAEEVSHASCLGVSCDDCTFMGAYDCLADLVRRNLLSEVEHD